MINNLNKQINKLYSQIHKKFLNYSEKLTENENKKMSMVSDWFSKKWSNRDFKEKDRYLTGIEKIEYTKEEQINFTSHYYTTNLKEIIAKSKNSVSIQNRLNSYCDIMKISVE